jgi:hypothetical protein
MRNIIINKGSSEQSEFVSGRQNLVGARIEVQELILLIQRGIMFFHLVSLHPHMSQAFRSLQQTIYFH